MHPNRSRLMGFNIVLVEPEIPTNTGNIGRLSLASGSTLHLIQPFGFEITDTRLKRAGLDYWQHLDVRTYESLGAFSTCGGSRRLVLAPRVVLGGPCDRAMLSGVPLHARDPTERLDRCRRVGSHAIASAAGANGAASS